MLKFNGGQRKYTALIAFPRLSLKLDNYSCNSKAI